MFAKNIVGIIIVLLNITGLCLLIYMGILSLIKKRRQSKIPEPRQKISSKKSGTKPVKNNQQFEDDEDNLLKDMDLSDLDDIDLDDFK